MQMGAMPDFTIFGYFLSIFSVWHMVDEFIGLDHQLLVALVKTQGWMIL